MQVLIADHDDAALASLEALLTRSGYSVTVARDGRRAFQLIEGGGFHLVLADCRIPQISGPELCRLIRSRINPGYVYTFLLSSLEGKRDTVAALRAGADDFLRKPFHPEELLLRLENAKRVVALGTRHAAIFAMAKLAESRDPDTGQHLERIRAYSWILARELTREFPEVTDEFVESLYHTSVLHDIGKVGIPDCVLLKPDRLTTREFEIMRTHTTIGADTLKATARAFPDIQFFAMAGDIALTHHENWDGSGYPAGLSGQAIPLCGRIVALADVYDALTSQRPYKSAYDHDVAKSLILEREAHFDPSVLRAFFSQEDQFLGVREALSDQQGAPVSS